MLTRILPVFLLYALALTVALWRNGFRASTARPHTVSDRTVTRVLIVGATGGTGRHLVAQALERGYEVTALVRNPAALAVGHARLRVVQGDVLDAAVVAQAVQGQDAVISALGHKRFLGPTRILSGGTRHLLRAMEAHGVRRFVCETSLGIGDSAGRMGLTYTLFVIPVILPFYFWDKTRQEAAIASSGVEWVVVRPGALTDGAARGAWRSGRGLGSFVSTVRISRADVAHFMLDQATDGAHVGSAVGVCW
jgi:putative NADH-flavin reductase